MTVLGGPTSNDVLELLDLSKKIGSRLLANHIRQNPLNSPLLQDKDIPHLSLFLGSFAKS